MPLAEFFREIANKELECNVSGFSSEARKALLTHAWPGNVRELRQKIMGAVLQAQEGVVTKEHLELAVTKPTSPVSFALRNDAEDKERIMTGEDGNDLYFNVSLNGQTYTFTVESYLCDNTTDVYNAVKNLKIGDTIDMEGFLYWYEGVNPHITSVTVK